MDALDIKPHNVKIVMGNHDVKQNQKQKENAILLRNKYREDGVIDHELLQSLESSYKPFYDVCADICGKSFSSNLPHYVDPRAEFNIICLNTALAHSYKHKGVEDRGNLIVGMTLLRDALSELDATKPGIVLAHHKIAMLQDDEGDDLEALLKDKGVLVYLCGDAHRADAINVTHQRPNQSLWEYVCGTNMDKRNPAKDKPDMSIFIGELNTKEKSGSVQALKFSKQGGGWVRYSEFSSRHTGLDDGIHRFPVDGPTVVGKKTYDSSCPECGTIIKLPNRVKKDTVAKYKGYWLLDLKIMDDRAYSLFHFDYKNKTNSYEFTGTDYDNSGKAVGVCTFDDIRTNETKAGFLYLGNVDMVGSVTIPQYRNIGAFIEVRQGNIHGFFINTQPPSGKKIDPYSILGKYTAHKICESDVIAAINKSRADTTDEYNKLARVSYRNYVKKLEESDE
jgi:hypothetical protein